MSYADSWTQEELERLILGTILNDPLLSVIKELKPEYFMDIRNQVICEIILGLEEKGGLEPFAVAEILKHKGIPEGIFYLEKLKEYGVRKELLSLLIEILQEEYSKNRRLAS